MIETETIECPVCNTVHEVDVFCTINAMESPDLVTKLMQGKVNIFKYGKCGHEAHIQLPLLFNDHRIDLKIQYYPEHWLEDNPEGVCNDYLGMLKQMEQFNQDFSPFIPDSCKPGHLLVVFSMNELINQIKFRNKLNEIA
jgi:hypothetical protein